MSEEVSLTLEMADESMRKALSHLEAELVKIRAGKATPQMLNAKCLRRSWKLNAEC